MIHFLRHGQSESNALGLLVGRSDPALTEFGRAQARRVAVLLEGVEEVWSSPLRRARETAALASPHVEARVEHSFIEVDYGVFDGTPLTQVSDDQWLAFETDHSVAFEGGESLASVDERVATRLDVLLADSGSYLHSPSRHLLVVSHVSPIKSAAVWALGVDGAVAWRTRVDNASITTIGVRRGSPHLVAMNVVVPHRDEN
jgi:probable phosphoglycerate mutase